MLVMSVLLVLVILVFDVEERKEVGFVVVTVVAVTVLNLGKTAVAVVGRNFGENRRICGDEKWRVSLGSR
jgi:dolichol kinase